jgi:CRP-like cAMP-binding protein
LLRRIEEYTDLPAEARKALEDLSARPARQIPARRDLIRQGAAPPAIYLVREGWACRYKTLPDGRRQVVDFLIPGDLCDLDIYILGRIDHSIGAVTALEIVEIPPEELQAIADSHPQITRALWWQELVSKSCHREWIVNVGARSAVARIAHLLCEMFLRVESIGGAQDRSCMFPLTQRDLADATGLTAVHVNRTLQRLRERGLISLQQRVLTIPDLAALMEAGEFNPDYLHLKRLDRHRGARLTPGA